MRNCIVVVALAFAATLPHSVDGQAAPTDTTPRITFGAFVDGYYAGTVNEFDGFAQGLRLEEGPYTIEIRAPGYEPLSINVRIQPGRKINYEGVLQKQ